MSETAPDGTTAIANRGADPYPLDIRAEAISLAFESGNYSEAAREMARRYPDRSPSRQLITRWCTQTDPERVAALCTERKQAFESGVMELGDLAREKLYDALHRLKPEQVAIPAGIAMDKTLRLLEIKKRRGGEIHAYGPTLIVIEDPPPGFRSEPDVIEGEASELEPEEPEA